MGNETLRDYQVADLAFYMRERKCGNLSDPGTGKTPSVCVMQWWLWDGNREKTIWVMPKSLLSKNRLELLRFTPFEPQDVVIVDGTPNQVTEQLRSEAKVFLMGFERFSRIVHGGSIPPGVKAIHVDEIHMGFGGHKSKRTKALYEAMRTRPWFLAMSGTLVNGRLDTVYPTIHVIEPRYYPSYDAFLHYHAYCDENDKPIVWLNHDKIAAILQKHCIRRTFKMIYGDQPEVELPELVSMSERHRKLYDELKDKAVLELEKFFVNGSLPGVAYIRCRQLMEHPNRFPDLTEPGQFVDILKGELTAKEERILIHLEDHKRTGLPLVIFAAFVPQHERLLWLCQEVGLTAAVMNGKVIGKRRDEVDEGFRSGRYQVLICSEAVAAVGFNWQHAGAHEVDHVIFASMNPVDTAFLQARMRFMRGQRTTPLRVTRLEYADSMDQRVFQIIKFKSKDANKVDASRPVLDFSVYEDAY